MTAEELGAFVAEVRAEAEERLAILRAVDAETLPPDLRAEYAEALEGWTALRNLTEDAAVELHAEACDAAGRELTPAELRGLLGLQ